MSSRVLKKLQGENELEIVETAPSEDRDGSDDEIDLSAANDKKKQFNLNRYDLLNPQSPSESEVKEDDNETEHASTAANLPSSHISKKKKKKKKVKKSAKHAGHHISSGTDDLTDKYLSEIDSYIAAKPHKLAKHTSTETADVDKSLLAVDHKNLNPQNEMRRTFGKRVVKIETKRGRPKPTLKSTYLVTMKEGWPPVTKDIISMKPCPAPDGTLAPKTTNWFAFEHSKFYQNIQNMFLSAVERTDSDFLVSLFRRCPYHVDSLIQLSELCKMTENFAMAAELIERAVLILESSLHPTFNLLSGNCRLDYRREENRCFFVVLFKQAQYLEARACSRTAFELSKLILSLNPEVDPLAMVLVIDYYAIRSKQYQWLVKFYEEWDGIKNLSQLPNMAYSYALALFHLLGDSEKANDALQYALLMFPGVLKPLLDELSVQTDQRVLGCNYFNSGVSGSQSPALDQLVCLYICRAKVIWRDPTILFWLEKNVNTALDRVDKKDEVVAEYNTKRSQRYVNPPRAILRHVVLADYKEKVPLAPFVSKEKDPIVMYDPLPPMDSINTYERKSSSSSPTSATANRPFSMFFQSMLPNFNLRAGAEQNAEGAVAGPAAEAGGNEDDNEAEVNRQLEALNVNLENVAEAQLGLANEVNHYRELTQSLTSIVDAMRDFISNIRLTEQSHNADGEGNGSTEEDISDYYD